MSPFSAECIEDIENIILNTKDIGTHIIQAVVACNKPGFEVSNEANDCSEALSSLVLEVGSLVESVKSIIGLFKSGDTAGGVEAIGTTIAELGNFINVVQSIKSECLPGTNDEAGCSAAFDKIIADA